MTQCFNDSKKMQEQYGVASRLDYRIQLHQLYSTSKISWIDWVFDNYELSAGQRILELGCGNGNLWKNNAPRLPKDIALCLSDFSVAMLEETKKNTASMIGVDYQQIDAQAIPFSADSFDIVIANHMLYHMPDLDRALREIARVLKPAGILYATTFGKGNFQELTDILKGFDSAIDLAQGAVSDAFGLESGQYKLGKYFASVTVRRYKDGLHITELQPLLNYVFSAQGIGNVNEVITKERLADFEVYMNEVFNKKGYIDICKDAGIIIARNPQ